MRDPLKRLARRDHPRMPLRERVDAAKARIAAVKDKAVTFSRVNLAMVRPMPQPVLLPDLDAEKQDAGASPRPPFGLPSPDAELLDALDLLSRTRDAQEAFLRTEADDADQHPAYLALEAAWDDALARLGRTRAETLSGLQAKARALRMSSGCIWPDDLVESLIADLLDADERALEQSSRL